MKELHEEKHFGRDKSVALISSSYLWPKLKHDVARYVCAKIQREKQPMLVFIFPSLFQLLHGLTEGWTLLLVCHELKDELIQFW